MLKWTNFTPKYRQIQNRTTLRCFRIPAAASFCSSIGNGLETHVPEIFLSEMIFVYQISILARYLHSKYSCVLNYSSGTFGLYVHLWYFWYKKIISDKKLFSIISDKVKYCLRPCWTLDNRTFDAMVSKKSNPEKVQV